MLTLFSVIFSTRAIKAVPKHEGLGLWTESYWPSHTRYHPPKPESYEMHIIVALRITVYSMKLYFMLVLYPVNPHHITKKY